MQDVAKGKQPPVRPTLKRRFQEYRITMREAKRDSQFTYGVRY